MPSSRHAYPRPCLVQRDRYRIKARLTYSLRTLLHRLRVQGMIRILPIDRETGEFDYGWKSPTSNDTVWELVRLTSTPYRHIIAAARAVDPALVGIDSDNKEYIRGLGLVSDVV